MRGLRRLQQAFLGAALAVLTLSVSHSSAQTPSAAPAAPEPLAETSVGTTISATDRMLAQVTVNGAGPYPFIVDTAAERSVISRELARELALPASGSARMLSITSSRDTAMVRLEQVSFVQGRSQQLNAFALAGQNLGASGILGIDALQGQRVVLDFEAQEMRVGPAPRRQERVGPTDIVVRGRRRYGQLVLVDSSVGDIPIDVVVDSGSQVSIGNTALRRLLVARRGQFQPLQLMSVTGEQFVADFTRVDTVRIGGVAIRGMPVAFADPYFFNRMRLTRRPALLLGMDSLQMFRSVAVDFPNRRAHFVLPENTPATLN